MASCRCAEMSACNDKIKKLSDALDLIEEEMDTYNSLVTSLTSVGNNGVSLYTKGSNDVVTKVKELGTGYKSAMSSMSAKITSKKEELEKEYNDLKKEDDEHHEEEQNL